MKFLEYMQRHVFGLLAMTASAYLRPNAPNDNLEVAMAQMQMVERGTDGSLKPTDGGLGLTCSVTDLQKVPTDLISSTPRLLKTETRAMIFGPGLSEGSYALHAFRAEAARYAASPLDG